MWVDLCFVITAVSLQESGFIGGSKKHHILLIKVIALNLTHIKDTELGRSSITGISETF